MTHNDVWNAIDAFARHHNRTVSYLAGHSGLDATTFNKSKRFTKHGQERWPSTNSISKILKANNCDLMDFVRIYMMSLDKLGKKKM
ncbi:MAG: hypothetical protein LBB23_03805 [Rickettsiales bacterium]|jgi:phage repressor protein C with HTH and peptisase S24 domain|nr:hypothetical protein [Rickettsiales bacterium]